MISRPGGPDVLQAVDLPLEDPGPDELRVALARFAGGDTRHHQRGAAA